MGIEKLVEILGEIEHHTNDVADMKKKCAVS